MQPQFFLLGANHQYAPMDMREKLFIPKDQLMQHLPEIKQKYFFNELMVLSTCNRFELIGVFEKEGVDQHILYEAYWLLQERAHQLLHQEKKSWQDALYLLRGAEAVQHVFRVASSLDSLVVGETQITGQFKDAVALAQNVDTFGPLLDRLSQEALRAAKRVRTQTAIGEKTVSISHAAIDLALKVFGDLRKHSFLVIGTGEMSELAVKYIMSYKPKSLTIVNRTLETAEKLIAKVGFGHAHSLTSLEDQLLTSDVVFSATGAIGHLISKESLKRLMKGRRGRPLFLLDMALPRDFEPECGDLDDVYLFDIDDLNQVVAGNISERQEASDQAEHIIAHCVEGFRQWLDTLSIKPALKEFRLYLDNLFAQEMEKSMQRNPLTDLLPEQVEALATMLLSIRNKMSSNVGRVIRKEEDSNRAQLLAKHLLELFETKNSK